MDTAELKRYNRQILLSELGIEGQQKLKDASVLVIGAGGLGCPLLLYLVAAGIGTIGITDHDLIDESNLHRQILYNANDLGKNKAETAALKLKLFNPHVELIAYPFKIDIDNSGSLIKKYDLVIDGSDNFPTRYLVNDACVLLNKPLIFGSIFKFEGQVSLFNYKGGPDYRSFYPEPPSPDEVPNCDESGVIGTLPGIIGTYMANEAIKIICGFGETLSGKLMVFDLLHNDIQIFSLYPKNIPEQGIQSSHSSESQKQLKTPVNFKKVTLKELEDWEDKKVVFCVIDVREDYEYEEYNIGGINIPLYELKDRIGDLPEGKKLVFYCRSGIRSKLAINLVKDEWKEELFIMTE